MNELKIGTFLQSLRKAKGVTQQELADLFEVSNKTVSKWECGQALPEIPLLKALAEYYGVTVDEILNGERSTRNLNRDREDNADFLNGKHMRKLNLFTLIAYLTEFVSAVLFIVLTYTVHRQDVGSFTGLGVALCGIIPLSLGFFLYGRSEDYFGDYVMKKKGFIGTNAGIFISVLAVLVFLDIYSYVQVEHATSVVTSYLEFQGLAVPMIVALTIALTVFAVYYYFFRMALSGNPDEFAKESGRFIHSFFRRAFRFVRDYNLYFMLFMGLYLILVYTMPNELITYHQGGNPSYGYVGGPSDYTWYEYWPMYVIFAGDMVFVSVFRKKYYVKPVAYAILLAGCIFEEFAVLEFGLEVYRLSFLIRVVFYSVLLALLILTAVKCVRKNHKKETEEVTE